MGSSRYQQQGGFSLLELVLSIVLLGILMAGSVAMLVNLGPKTVDPAMEVRAAQLAQRLLNDISLQKYDHANNSFACRLADSTAEGEICTPAAEWGPDAGETSMALFNDVDDYDTMAICNKLNVSGCKDGWLPACWFTEPAQVCQDNNHAYAQFMVKITVTLRPFNAQSAANSAKLININIRQPNGSEWPFSVLRGNYP